jgi:hypothetical protein
MKKIIFILAILCLFGCKKETNEEVIESYDPIFRDEVREFLKDAKTYGNKDLKLKKLSIIIQYSEPPKCIGCDAFYDHEFNTIYVDTTTYAFKFQKTELMYHELGHALLFRDHNNNILPGGDQESLMNVGLVSDYENNVDYYLTELFNNP